MKAQYEMVREFHELFSNNPEPKKPTKLDYKRRFFRYKMFMEESYEFLKADTLVDQLDAAVDLLYFVLGALVSMGLEPSEAFEIVHKCNMNKLDKNGEPIFDELGKLLKPENWTGPEEELKELIKRYANK